MTIYPARKRTALFSLDCCLRLCRCVVLCMTCPLDENVSYRIKTSLPEMQDESKNIVGCNSPHIKKMTGLNRARTHNYS